MKIPIVFSTDNNYVMPTGVTILSLLESACPETVYAIYVLINNDVTEESKNLLRKQVECFPNHTIDFIEIGNVFQNAFEIRNVSVATYSRLLIPWLLPEYDKIFYSDVDVIFHIDLSDVYNINMSDKLIAGVKTYSLRFNRKAVKYLKKIDLEVEEYINAGILLINSKLQRDWNLREQFLKEAQKKYIYQDQDIINKVCKGFIEYLPPAYNLTGSFNNMLYSNDTDFRKFYESTKYLPRILDLTNPIESYKRAENCILHYTGNKPWNSFTQSWKEWWNTYQRSIFYDSDLEIEVSRQILSSIQPRQSIAIEIKRKIFNILTSSIRHR